MTVPRKFVVDTNLLISSVLRRNTPPSRLLDWVIEHGFFAFSHATFAEFKSVLNRHKFDRYLSNESREIHIERLLDSAIFVLPEKHFQLCRDPKDNVFLDVAVAAQADVLVTGDDDLLSLQEIEGIPITTAAEALKRQAKPTY